MAVTDPNPTAAGVLIFAGIVAGVFGLEQAKTGGLIFHHWLLLPPSSYLSMIGGILCLLVGAFLLGRGRRD